MYYSNAEGSCMYRSRVDLIVMRFVYVYCDLGGVVPVQLVFETNHHVQLYSVTSLLTHSWSAALCLQFIEFHIEAE